MISKVSISVKVVLYTLALNLHFQVTLMNLMLNIEINVTKFKSVNYSIN